MLQFDWTTFILEILNFLVLLWIMQRLFYRPVLNALDSRRQKIKEQFALAEAMRCEAESLHQQYESMLLDWDQQQQAQRQQQEQELGQMRQNAMENLKQALAAEEIKLRGRNQALIAANESVVLKQATDKAFRSSIQMLHRLASPELTHQIIEIFLADLSSLSESQQTALRHTIQTATDDFCIEIISAHDLPEHDRMALTQALSKFAEHPISFSFKLDPGLIAGIRSSVGEWQLHANFADELGFFKQQNSHE